MPRLIWTARALSDVERLHRFLARKDAAAAGRAVRAIRAGVSILLDQPRLGRGTGPAQDELRERLIDFGRSGYVVLYRVDAESVVLLSIRHQSEAGY